MPTPRKNQKQIAQKYSGNLRYFKNVNSFRLARILAALILALLAVGLGVFYLFGMKASSRFEGLSSSGGISQSHAKFATDCAKCHDPVTKVDPLNPVVVSASLDAKCEVCHVAHTFHAADTVLDHSCTACHHEHLGTGPMQPVTDNNCLTCHGNGNIMAESAQKASTLPASAFKFVPKDTSLVYFQPPRPAAGYTQAFQSFEDGHPDFQIQREKLTDPNTLKFDHKFHLTGPVPMVDGHKLDCNFCHKPDSRGAYMQPISFAKNCQVCHQLQIDPTEPGFQIPHPTGESQPNSVRDFLLTLPSQYQSYAVKKGITDPAKIAAYVNGKLTGIRARTRAGEDLVAEVFQSDTSKVNFGFAPTSGPGLRPVFQGCALCHEVKEAGGRDATLTPPQTANYWLNRSLVGRDFTVTPPRTPDRWFVHARFDHSAHITMSCETCHDKTTEPPGVAKFANGVRASEKTSDILLPEKASCVTCHSAKGGVVSTCATCHDYHNQAPAHDVANDSSVRAMMLGHP